MKTLCTEVTLRAHVANTARCKALNMAGCEGSADVARSSRGAGVLFSFSVEEGGSAFCDLRPFFPFTCGERRPSFRKRQE